MALNINGTALKKCNVNGIACKHINVNGVNVWNAEYVFFPSTYVCNKDNWTNHGDGSGTFTITDTSIYLSGYSGGSDWTLYDYFVDFSKYKKMYITITSVNNNRKFRIRWREKDTGTSMSLLDVSELAEDERVKTHEIDISSIDSQCYLTFSFSNGGGGTITKIWFEE